MQDLDLAASDLNPAVRDLNLPVHGLIVRKRIPDNPRFANLVPRLAFRLNVPAEIHPA